LTTCKIKVITWSKTFYLKLQINNFWKLVAWQIFYLEQITFDNLQDKSYHMIKNIWSEITGQVGLQLLKQFQSCNMTFFLSWANNFWQLARKKLSHDQKHFHMTNFLSRANNFWQLVRKKLSHDQKHLIWNYRFTTFETNLILWHDKFVISSK